MPRAGAIHFFEFKHGGVGKTASLDTHDWAKRPGGSISDGARHEQDELGNIFLKSRYVRHATDEDFFRRIYQLADSDSNVRMVHYIRRASNASRPKRHLVSRSTGPAKKSKKIVEAATVGPPPPLVPAEVSGSHHGSFGPVPRLGDDEVRQKP